MTNTDESTLPETGLVEAVWRYRWSSLFIAILCGVAAVGATALIFSKVQATARFAVTDPQAQDSLKQGVSAGQNYAAYTAQRAAYAYSASVLRRASRLVVAKNGRPPSLEEMRRSVSTRAKPDGGIVEVTASAADMPGSAAIANAVVQAYQDLTAADMRDRKDQFIKDIQAQENKISVQLANTKGGVRVSGSLTDQLSRLRAREDQLIADTTTSGSGVQFVDQADPTVIAPSKLPRNAAVGGAVGVLIACIVAFLRATAPNGAGPAAARRGRRDAASRAAAARDTAA